MTTPDELLNGLIEDVTEASKLPAKKRGTSIKPTVERLTSAIYEHGLESEQLGKLLDLICTPSYLDQASLNALINNLYPATSIRSDDILKMVGCLGQGELKPSYSIQAGLLRWLVMVYHVIQEPVILSHAYAVLFNLLETAAIRPQLCHVLAVITRRKHVRPFRIQALLQFSRTSDPPLIGLLRIFKDYYPEIIVAEAVRGKASAFKHPDPAWRERLNDIQREHAQRTAIDSLQPRHGFSVNRDNFRRGAAPRPSGIPGTSVTLEEVNSADKLVQNIDKIELPSQLAAVLVDPLLQKLLVLRKDETTSRRVTRWIGAALADFLEGNSDTKSFVDMMDVLADFVTRTKETPPIILNFLVKLFATWNGVDAQASIITIMSYATLMDFADLELLLVPLEKCLPAIVEAQLSLLGLYRDLLRHWTALLKSLDAVPQDRPLKSIRGLQVRANALALNLVHAFPSQRVHAAVLEFYEQAAATTTDPFLEPSLRIAHPPAELVYSLFFSSSLVNVSRLSGVLARYKTAFETAMVRDRSAYTNKDLRQFNGFLMDLCNCLWRGRAFNATDRNALACTASPAVISRYQRYVDSLNDDLHLHWLFGFSFSPVLCSRSIAYVRLLEDEADAEALSAGRRGLSTRHAGPVTQSSLQRLAAARGLQLAWAEYRVHVLHGLDGEGLVGIGALMRNVMKGLQGGPLSSQVMSSQTSRIG
ncbi:Mis6 domain-containing protein [Plectosphaerella plurivora]|uniref:Mis6 domain-containing protein n=1 Tax=Plectosphaerella plurivora TaxID=936078 RepID=A0A9P8VE77_9PEZI|nr:Mis6 domain-containing protein [Plectosphaerella plurivora]